MKAKIWLFVPVVFLKSFFLSASEPVVCPQDAYEFGQNGGRDTCEFIINGLVGLRVDDSHPCNTEQAKECKQGMQDYLEKQNIFSKVCKRLIEKNVPVVEPFPREVENPEAVETTKVAWERALNENCAFLSVP